MTPDVTLEAITIDLSPITTGNIEVVSSSSIVAFFVALHKINLRCTQFLTL